MVGKQRPGVRGADAALAFPLFSKHIEHLLCALLRTPGVQ